MHGLRLSHRCRWPAKTSKAVTEPRSRGSSAASSASSGVHRIIIAPTTTDNSGVVDLIRIAKASGVRVSVLPRMFEVVGSAVEFDDVDGMTMLGVRRFGLSRSSRLLKRSFDVVVTSIALLFLAPVILGDRDWRSGSTHAARSSSGRSGSGATARHFRIFKFRSMVVDADERKERAARAQRGRRRPVQDHQRPAGHPRRSASCATRRSTSCPSSSTSCAAR